MIQAINKVINKNEVKGKYIFAHEHINFNLSHIRKDSFSSMDDNEIIEKELQPAIDNGLGLIVDLSNQSMNSKKEKLAELSEKINIPIVSATGYYLNEYEINNDKTVEELEEEFKSHIINGFDNKFKAGIIGEIATSSDKIHDFEKRVFQAAVNVQKELGVPIYTHLNLGSFALGQKDLLINNGVIPNKTIIGHVEFIKDIKEIEEILNSGFLIGIDTIGKQNYLSDKIRADLIVELINKGHEDKIVISLDISKQDYLFSKGGHGYGHLINNFYPLIKNRINDSQWHKISFKNILNILDWK